MKTVSKSYNVEIGNLYDPDDFKLIMDNFDWRGNKKDLLMVLLSEDKSERHSEVEGFREVAPDRLVYFFEQAHWQECTQVIFYG